MPGNRNCTRYPKKMAKICRIVDERSAAKVSGQTIDLFTASAIMNVYDQLSPDNQAKYAKMPVRRMATIAWKLTK